MKYNYFDVHAHVHGEYGEGVDINVYKDSGVGCITVGTDLATSIEAVKLAEEHENIWATIGVHPVDDRKADFDIEAFSKLLKSSNKVVALGECGIDYYYDGLEVSSEEKERQKNLFITQIEFAVKHGLPLMIHGRPSKGSMNAYEDILGILQKTKLEHGDKVRGNVHFFVGNVDIASEFISLGFTFSFSGVITFAKEYEEVVRFIPIEFIHAETDSPYATPIPFRGKINSPLYVEHVYRKIAELKGLSIEETKRVLLGNVTRTFDIKLNQILL